MTNGDKSSGKPYFVYMLECSNGSYYTGYTVDPVKRFAEHGGKKPGGARFTRSFAPGRIVACWRIVGGRGAAMSVEAFIKGMRRKEKEKLVADPASLSASYSEKTGTMTSTTVEFVG